MAEGKKSFVLYADLKPTIKKLVENDRINKTNNAGELFLHILEYVTDKNPEAINFIVDVSFEPIKQQLKRDLVKFEEVKCKRSDAGKASAEARKLAKLQEQSLTNSTSVKSVQQTSTNSTVNDNDSVNVNVNEIKNSIDSRKLKFADTLKPFTEIYGRELIKEFYGYWTEPNKSNTKFKQELERTWSLERRLETWSKNDKNFNNRNNGTGQPTKSKAELLNDDLRDWVNEARVQANEKPYEQPNTSGQGFEDIEYRE